MSTVKIDFSKKIGKIGPMHAVNNGPAGSAVRGGFESYTAYKNAGIPYARNHDASFYSGYGGEHTVDVHRIFKNFDADVNDPASYVFEPTDKYLKDIESVGAKVFYRLGSAIEHGYKYGTYPPKDYLKWAQICEHIIRHYTEGWANGYYMDIKYWEIWNEPDCMNADGSNPCWQGTWNEFNDFFVVTFKYLKEKFPHLKIGGPAVCTMHSKGFLVPFFERLIEENICLDFFSFHRYCSDPKDFEFPIDEAKRYLEKSGMLGKTELILNEWNYVRGWLNEEWKYTIRSEKGMKGAAFIAGVMAVCQAKGLDILMYYDARPTNMNGMFDTTTLENLKGYYPFLMFNELYNLENSCFVASDDDEVYAVAAEKDGSTAAMICYFSDDDTKGEKEITISLTGNNKNLELFVLDDEKDCENMGTFNLSDRKVLLKRNSVILIKSV